MKHFFDVVLSLSKHIPNLKKFVTLRQAQGDNSYSLIYILLIATIILCSGCGKETEKIVVATDTTLIPMSFINDQNEISGFEPDLIRSIAKTAGLEIDLINVEWAGLFGGLITRKYDLVISSVTILEERKKKMAFSQPYLQSGLALVVRKDMEGVGSIKDMKNKNLLIGAQVGTTAYFYLEKDPSFRKKGYQLYGHAIADLIKGEIDGALGESSGTLYYKSHDAKVFQKIKMVGETLTDEYYGIVMRKENTQLHEQINTALTQLLNDGTVKRLHDKWELGKAASVP